MVSHSQTVPEIPGFRARGALNPGYRLYGFHRNENRYNSLPLTKRTTGSPALHETNKTGGTHP